MLHRPLAPGDFAALHALYVAPENSPFLDYEPVELLAFRPIFDDVAAQGDTFLVVEETRVVATYRLRVQAHRCSHVATLAGLAVAPSLQGKGVGAEILAEIVEIARSRGVRRLELLVEADNTRALRFYERHGFVREGLLRGAFRRRSDASDVDEIAMARRLDAGD